MIEQTCGLSMVMLVSIYMTTNNHTTVLRLGLSKKWNEPLHVNPTCR